MENLCFKCSVCKNYIRMNKKLDDLFSDWAYACGEWSDFGEDVPELSKQNWIHSELTPVVGETRTVFVRMPFDETIGNEFWLLYEPALLYFNSWEDCSEQDIANCAVVRCKFQKILISDEYSAWIRVTVQEVVFLHELCNYYQDIRGNISNAFKGITEETEFQNDRWHVTSWTMQNDCGEMKWIYIDENGIRHLVMKLWYAFDEEILYIGNIRDF